MACILQLHAKWLDNGSSWPWKPLFFRFLVVVAEQKKSVLQNGAFL